MVVCITSSGFPLTNHFGLPGSETIFGISQEPPVCACTSLSLAGFQRRGLGVDGYYSAFHLQGTFYLGRSP